VHVYALKPWLKRRRPWRVRRVERLAPDIHELTLAPDGHDGLAFRAGQFVWLRIAPGAWGIREHPFSIASAPGDAPALRFVIKANGDFTVGLAPILSLLRERAHAGDRRPIRLIHACRWQRDLVLESELGQLTAQLDLEVFTVVDEAERPARALPGPVDRALLERVLPPVARERIACSICAPPGMIDAMETALVGLGVPSRHIASERFRYRYAAASPVARRIRRAYAAVAALLVLATIAFSVAA